MRERKWKRGEERMRDTRRNEGEIVEEIRGKNEIY